MWRELGVISNTAKAENTGSKVVNYKIYSPSSKFKASHIQSVTNQNGGLGFKDDLTSKFFKSAGKNIDQSVCQSRLKRQLQSSRISQNIGRKTQTQGNQSIVENLNIIKSQSPNLLQCESSQQFKVKILIDQLSKPKKLEDQFHRKQKIEKIKKNIQIIKKDFKNSRQQIQKQILLFRNQLTQAQIQTNNFSQNNNKSNGKNQIQSQTTVSTQTIIKLQHLTPQVISYITRQAKNYHNNLNDLNTRKNQLLEKIKINQG